MSTNGKGPAPRPYSTAAMDAGMKRIDWSKRPERVGCERHARQHPYCGECLKLNQEKNDQPTRGATE